MLDYREFVLLVSISKHWKKLAFSFPFSLSLFNLFYWKAHFQFFNTLRHCPWNLFHPGITNKSTKQSTWEVTMLVLNDTHTQPFLEQFSLFTEIYVSSPSYSILLEFCSQPVSSPHSFPRQTCQLINAACIPYSFTCDLQQLMLCLAPSFWVIQTIAVMVFFGLWLGFFFCRSLIFESFLLISYYLAVLLNCIQPQMTNFPVFTPPYNYTSPPIWRADGFPVKS